MYGKEHHWLSGRAGRRPRGCLARLPRVYVRPCGVRWSIDLHRSCASESLYLDVEQFGKRETLEVTDNSSDIDD
jgi:hypothetical protein